MPKPISVILHDSKIIGSFTCRDKAIAEFKKLEITEGEISLHLLDRPDRKKKAVKSIAPKLVVTSAGLKKNILQTDV